MEYAKQFVKYARQQLPDWQFAAIHHKAHSAAGGAAPRKGSGEDETAGDMESIEDQDPAQIVTKALNDVRGGSLAMSLDALDLDGAYAIACAALETVAKAVEPSVDAAVAHHRLQPLEHPLFDRICKRAGGSLPILDASRAKQVLYCVGLEPDTYDVQNDAVEAEEIEKTAHRFLTESRLIGSMHSKAINAVPVESYIAPQDLVFDGGPFGRQTVKKGSWVLGIKVSDPREWAKVVNGDYTGISVGGQGQRKNAE